MHPGTGSNHLSRSNNSGRKAKPQTLKELEKYVTENRMIMEELKADLKSIRYEIVNKLIEFTKFGQSLAAETQEPQKGKTDREIRIAKLEGMLRVTAEEIEKKEAQESEILEAYYATRASYLKNHQRWRNAVYREVARLRSEGKTAESPEMAQFSKLLIKGDDNANEFEKRTTTEWRGQMLSEKNVFFDAENGKLGQGAFGAVYKGRVFHSECAIKVLSTKQMSEAAKEEFKAEVITLSNLQHDRVLRFLGAVLDDKKMMLVTELCANGSMADRLFPPLKVKKTSADDDSDDEDCEDRPRKPVAGKKKKTYYTLSPKKKLHIMRGIIEGLIFLHEHKIVHYDLKPENILLDEEFNPVIADFGLARILNIEDVLGLSSGMGTPFYMAPEMLTTPVQLSPKCDVYAFGFIAWELWTQERNEWSGSMTGSGINTQSLYSIIKSGKRPSLDRPDKPFPHTMKLLISKCWDFDPNNRPDFKYMQFVVQDPSVLEKAKKWNELKDSLRESANPKKSEQVKELEKFLCMLPNDAFFVMYDELTVAEVSKNTKTWDEIVRNIEGIKPGEKTGPLDSYELPWEKFVVEYPKVMGLPEFKAEEHILFRIFMIQDQATQAVPVVTKKDYDLYLKFYNPKPDFAFLQELLNLPYYFGRYENKDRMMAAFKDDSYCYFIRQSSNIPSYVISFKAGPQTQVSSCPLSTETSMDSVSLLKFLKDRNNILKKMTAHCQERVEKSKWHEVKSIFRPDALAVAQLELKEIKDMRSKLKKKGLKDQEVKVKHPNAGMYVFGGPLPENGEEEEGVNTFAKGDSKFT